MHNMTQVKFETPESILTDESMKDHEMRTFWSERNAEHPEPSQLVGKRRERERERERDGKMVMERKREKERKTLDRASQESNCLHK